MLGVAITYAAARVYLGYQAHRAQEMFAELQAIQDGQPKTALLPLIERYDNPHFSFGQYGVLMVDPWHMRSPFARWKAIDEAVRYVLFDCCENLRRDLGLRAWVAYGNIEFENDRVSSVGGTVLVEGANEWLGASWQQVPDVATWQTKRFGPDSRFGTGQYLSGWTHLHMGLDTGEVIWNTIGTDATAAERHAAQSINGACLTSTRGCQSLCDLMPDAVRYRHQHGYGDLGWNSGSWAAQDHSCR